MIVKGTKQLGSFKRGINLYIPKKNQSVLLEQVIWRVLLSGAGSPEFDLEYSWNGTNTLNGKPVYTQTVYGSTPVYIVWNSGVSSWFLTFNSTDSDRAERVYASVDLIVWTRPNAGGDDPPPAGQLFYTP